MPYQSLDWLIKQLEAQGQSQEQLSDMNEGAQAQLANKVSGGMPSAPAPGTGFSSGMAPIESQAPMPGDEKLSMMG